MNVAVPILPAPDAGSSQPGTNKPPRLQSIAFGNFLSFGPEMPKLSLGSLNVLVGPNGSGKSNLLEAIAFLRSSATDMRPVILRGGGVSEWIWKGAPFGNATLEAIFSNPAGNQPLRHVLSFRAEQQNFRLVDEQIEYETAYGSKSDVYYRSRNGDFVINTRDEGKRQIRQESVQPDLSILSQFRDPERYPEISYLADTYGRIRLYREWSFGRNTVVRLPQRADQRNDRLEEDFSNLGLFLNRISLKPRIKNTLIEHLKNLYESLTSFEISVQGGTVQVFFMEGDFSIPATRLSDGSIRYLCLLAILCDPEPPPLICLEEPELGLHPDLLPKIADLLVTASQRTQLIVTTHSDILVDALSEHPDALIICEKHKGCTEMRTLPKNEVQPWLEKYRLGELWTSGQLGGNRW